MKKIALSLSASLAIGLIVGIKPLSVLAKSFPDIPDYHPNAASVDYLSDIGVFKGNESGEFFPNKDLTRAEVVVLALRLRGVEIPESTEQQLFSDVPVDTWYAAPIAKAVELGMINGYPDGRFGPEDKVNRAQISKIVLELFRFISSKWANREIFSDISRDAWYSSYLNYAGTVGALKPDKQNRILPDKTVSRGEAAEFLYIIHTIMNDDPQTLLTKADAQMTQIEKYMAHNKVSLAKYASLLAVDMTQQALKLKPEDKIVLSAAKLARSYQFLTDGVIAASQGNTQQAITLFEQAVIKAKEGEEANSNIKAIVEHIEKRATLLTEDTKALAGHSSAPEDSTLTQE